VLEGKYRRLITRRLEFAKLYVSEALTTLKNAGLHCDPCGGPLNIIVQRERERRKGLTFWYINISMDEKLKWAVYYNFYFL